MVASTSLWSFAAILVLACLSRSIAVQSDEISYNRLLLGRGQDPSIAYYNGWYYYADIDFYSKVFVWMSKDLETIFEGTPLEVYRAASKVVTEAPDIALVFDGAGCNCSRWVITYSTVVDDGISVLITEGDDATKLWNSLGPIPGIKGYDSNLLRHPDGSFYLLYSTYSALNIVPFDVFRGEPRGSPAVISRPTQPWEGAGLNEAPASVIAGDTINVVFSTGRYYLPEYNCGLLQASILDDLMDPTSWSKDPKPVFQSNPARNFYGPGSGCFFGPGLQDMWWAYGGFTSPTGIDKDHGHRVIRAQQVSFTDGGTVELGQAGATASMRIQQPRDANREA